MERSVFPQFTPGGRAGIGAARSGGWYMDGVSHAGLGEMEDWERTDGGLRFVCKGRGTICRLSHTHETPLLLTEGCSPPYERLYGELQVWGPSIIRVRYGAAKVPPDPYAGLPPEARMLTGRPVPCDFRIEDKEDSLRLSTAAVTVTLDKATSRISLRSSEGRLLCRQQRTDLFTADILPASVAVHGDERAAFEAFELEADEDIYGLGERFDGVSRRGRSVDFWNKDAVGTTSPRTYINIPFYISTKGYGLFLHSSARTGWEIGTRDAATAGFYVQDSQMDYFLLAGRRPADLLSLYHSLTGAPRLPPLWSFGLWMSRNSYTTWEAAEEVGETLRSRAIPCDVLHLDTAWFQEDWNCDLRFSSTRFPEPEKHIRALRDKGFHVSLWQYNYLPPRDDNPNYREACEKGYTAQNREGGVYRLPAEWTGSWVDDVVIDFSNPEAREWYGKQIRRLMEMGIGAMKTDFGEGIPEDASYAAIDGRFFHNLYPLAYNYTIWKETREVSGEDIVWARSGTAGSQRYPVHWGGDSQCTFAALAGTLRGALSAGISGIPFFSHDIGGFIGLPTPELYVRWAQVGLFSSHSRCHGAGDTTYREPWRFGPQAEEIFRFYTRLRYSLMPYIYRQAEKCTRTGLPMLRSLYLAYPEDRNVRHIEDEYLFGDDFLVAPVLRPLEETVIRTLYLPAGDWVDYWTREVICSRGEWLDREVDLKTMPLYVRRGTTLQYAAPVSHLSGGWGEIVKTEAF